MTLRIQTSYCESLLKAKPTSPPLQAQALGKQPSLSRPSQQHVGNIGRQKAHQKDFVWAKSANDILASIERLCRRISNSKHYCESYHPHESMRMVCWW